jgi:hypothetical protein
MTEYRIDVDSADADRRIRYLTASLSDLRSFWPIVTRIARGWWKQQFATRGAFGGQEWPQLSPAYRKWKERKYPGREILVATRQLKRAADNPRRFPLPTSLTLLIDDSGKEHGPVLQYHQEGKGVPARPLVFGDPLPPVAHAELQTAADNYVRDLLHRL